MLFNFAIIFTLAHPSLIPVRSISSMNFLADALLLFSSTRQMANIIDSNLVLKSGERKKSFMLSLQRHFPSTRSDLT